MYGELGREVECRKLPSVPTYYSSLCLERQKKTVTSVRVVGAPTKTRIWFVSSVALSQR
jgi:hypothetical protein